MDRLSGGRRNGFAGYRAAGRAKAQGDVALVIGTDTTHPTPGRIRLVSALLENRPVSRLCASQFEPANSRYRIGAHRIIVEHRLVTIGKAAISVTEHQPICNGVEPRRWFRFEAHSLRVVGQSEVNDAAPTLASSEKVEFAGVVKSTWYAQIL